MNIIKKHMKLIAIGSLLLSSTAQANSSKPNMFDNGNKWHITFYNDSTSNHAQWATQEIYFLPYSVVVSAFRNIAGSFLY